MSSVFTPTQAVILAAGLGTRMRPITEHVPKPLVKIGGKAMLDWALDAAEAVGVETVFINVYYLADQVEAHLQSRMNLRIILSDERAQLLDSGGGIEKMLPQMASEPFYLLNADTFWLDEGQDNLAELASAWDEVNMDILLMLAEPSQATGHGTTTDFLRGEDGRLARSGAGHAGYIYAGAAILHPRLFAGIERGKHSLNLHFDAAIDSGRLYGWPMRGKWITVGTPDAIAPAEAVIAEHRMKR